MVISDYIPDGATVTPVDDYTIWLRCAELRNTYGSLANVIANSTAMETLCNNLNALRYMVRSVEIITPAVLADNDWITALKESVYGVSVPTMTSNTKPRGVASSDSIYAGYEPYFAFDKSDARFISALSHGTHYLRYQFTTDIWPFAFNIRNSYATYNAGFKNAKLQGSTNGSTWTDLTENILFPTNTTLTEYVVSAENANSFDYVQIIGSDAYYADGRVGVTELNIYGLDLS